MIATNPAEVVRVDRRRSEDDEGETIVIPTKDQIRAMVAKAPALWPLVRTVTTHARDKKIVPVPWQPLIITAIFTGMRQSELRGLAWTFVDFKAGVIRVRQRADRWGTLGPVKTKTSKRDIAMAPIIARVLREWKLACPKTELDLVFPSKCGRILLQANVLNQGSYPLLKACDLYSPADVESKPEALFNVHCLRHAAASLFIDQGWSPKKIQKVMGHSSIQVTYDIYGHLFPSADDDQRAMAEANLLG